MRPHALIGGGCLSVLALGAVPILAQQGSSPVEGGPVLTFGISSTLSATDNYNLDPDRDENAELFDTRLSLGYRTRRPNDALSLDLSGVLRANEPPRGSKTVDDRRARLGYDRQGLNSALSLGADYSLSSVDARNPFDADRILEDDPLDETDLTRDRGDEERISTRFRFESGFNAPLGVVLSGRYREQSFTDTTDPDLFDTEIFDVSATTRLTLSPITEARLVLRYEDFSADDAERTDRQTSSLNLGLTQALSQVDTLDVSLGLQEIETDETLSGTRRTRTETGVIGSVDLTRVLTRGTIGTSFDLSESENGRTATWLVRRALPLPRGGLAFSLGATSDVDDSVVPVGSVNLTHEMTRSTLTAALERQVATSTRSNELRTTRASLGYRYRINTVSDMAFSANFAEVSQAGGPAVSDTTRTDLAATYSRELTPDWRLSSGYEFRVRDEDRIGTATSNRVFLTLAREFVIRP